MKILILDDDQTRHDLFKKKFYLNSDELYHAYTAEQCINELGRTKFDMVCLDHDLDKTQMVDSGDGTGYEVCEWLSNNIEHACGLIVIHSFNPIGARNMHNILLSAGINSFIRPAFWKK